MKVKFRKLNKKYTFRHVVNVIMDEEEINMLIEMCENEEKIPSQIVKDAIRHLYEKEFSE